MLNIHPALLPAFRGLDTHRRALAAGVKIHGATVHFVSAEMDAGPIVTQGAVAVREGEDAKSLAARVLEVEHRILLLWRSVWSRQAVCAWSAGVASLMGAQPSAMR